MHKYIAYYRVSTDKQGRSGLGLEAQRVAIEKYVADDLILDEYTEIESGKKVKNRPKLLEALIACKKCKATLIIAKLDRLARNVHFVSGLMESGVDFVAVDNPKADKLMIHMLAVFAEYERDLTSQRTKDALKAAKARGVILGKAGKVRAIENKQRADDFAKSMEPVLNEIMDRDIVTYSGMCNELNRMNVPTYKGYGKWHTANLCRLMKR